MNVIKITNSKQWNNFVAENSSPASFLQSWEFGEIQKEFGHSIFRFGIVKENTIVAITQLVVKKLLGKKTYITLERGVVINDQFSISNFQKIWNTLLVEIKRIAKKHNAVFLRVSPLESQTLPVGFQNPKILRKLHPPHATLLSNLSYSEEEMLVAMHKKTRYNINLAKKKGVTVKESDLDTFYTLMKQTSERQGIKIFHKSHYQQLFKHNTHVMTAYYNEQPIATAMFLTFSDTTTYLHGGSNHEYRSVMAPYLLHWEIMKHSKQSGQKWYDWWGISSHKHSDWNGITRFKKGFVNSKTSKEITYPKTQDFVYQQFWYMVFSVGKYLYDFTNKFK